jgi:hypothetical protein
VRGPSAEEAPSAQLAPGFAAEVLYQQQTLGNQSVIRSLQRSANGSSAAAPEPPSEEEVLPEADDTPLEIEEDYGADEYADLGDQDLPFDTILDPDEENLSAAPRAASAAPHAGFTDRGRVGTVAAGTPISLDDGLAHAFTDGGRAGDVAWAGGGGAGPHSVEAVGSVQREVPPIFESKKNATDFDATVKAATGEIDVTRSFVSSAAGDQGNGWFVTVKAAARLDAHERLHTASASGHYNTHIVPLLARVADASLGKGAASAAAAIAKLRTAVAWPASVKKFQDADLADNLPMKTVDTADLATGTYVVASGPGVVAGKAYTNRLRVPGEPNPT